MTDNTSMELYTAPKTSLIAKRNNYEVQIGAFSCTLVRDVDFGKVPKAKSPSLWKAGAEKILMGYGLYYDVVLTDSHKDYANGFFYYEFTESDLPRQQVKDFTTLVDNKLKELNIEYHAKRESHRIKHPHTHLLQENSFQKFKEMSVAQGARDAQFKLNRLMQDEKRHGMFKELIKK